MSTQITPEFDPSKFPVLFFSRGRGRGHAVPDMAILEELRRSRDDFDMRFVSYATGAATLSENRYAVIDIGLPEANPVLETMIRVSKIIGWLQPKLVISHEEFMALPAAKIFDLPTLMITDWFTAPEKFAMQTLQYADEIVFIDDPGAFEEPEYLQGRIQYVGPVLREFQYSRADRARAREELELPSEATVISVLPGSWTEERAPVADVVLDAFELLSAPKHLVWLAGADREELARRTEGRRDITVRKSDWQIDRLMAASDLAITKSNRKTVKELESLGIWSISLTHGLNAPDDAVTGKVATNCLLDAKSTTAAHLAETIRELIAAPAPEPLERTACPDGRRRAAERISKMIDAIQGVAKAASAG
jgi:UDP-N-acetylglucosamine:LPS N-acetylglucosamine transferase